jgi:hypothetical protein
LYGFGVLDPEIHIGGGFSADLADFILGTALALLDMETGETYL